LDRYERYRADSADVAVIDLSSNFRSRGPLINVINSVFERLMTRDAVEIEYDQSHRLRPGAIYPPAGKGLKPFNGSPVELHLLPPVPRGGSEDSDDQDLDRTEREAAFVAKRIADLMSERHYVADKAPDGSVIYRALQYRDIVVLLRSMKYKSEQFADMLRAAGVPVHTESGTGFFESMEIRDMLSLLRLLDNQQQDLPMAAVLRSPLSGVADAEDSLARIRLAYPHSDEVPFHRAVVKYANEKDDELAAQLRAFLRSLSEWRRLAHQRPLAELIWQIYDSTGYLAFCTGMDDGEQRVANLIDFHERARQFGSFQKQGLSRFMAFLESLAEQSDLGQPSVASEADDVVRVMSIHRSKGLEFPVVIIPDLGKRHNMQDIAGPILVDLEAGIGLMVAYETLRVRYPSLAHVLVQQRIGRQTLAEEMRVLYVAMTRAREHLILVGSCEEDKPQTWRDQWATHRGPLPAERILGALTMLDWLGPAAAAIEGARSADRIEITWHDETQISQWTTAAVKRREMSDEMRRLARLEPLAPAPATHPDAEQVRRRLTDGYRFREFTQLSAVQSVGSLTKHGRVAPGAHSPSREGVVAFDAELSAPRCVLTQTRISATDAGSATHLVLEHLDFTRPCDVEDLRAQAAELVRKKLLASELAQAVELDSIVWLMSTPLGALLRIHAKALRREVPIYFPQSSPDADRSSEPLDCVMVRGRIDLLIQDGNELTLVDFKTDQVNEQTVDARVEFYKPQISSYRAAIEAITGMPVRAAMLVFLKAQSIREV
jgi:ATP-dependent helicase/nuclease subunit A